MSEMWREGGPARQQVPLMRRNRRPLHARHPRRPEGSRCPEQVTPIPIRAQAGILSIPPSKSGGALSCLNLPSARFARNILLKTRRPSALPKGSRGLLVFAGRSRPVGDPLRNRIVRKRKAASSVRSVESPREDNEGSPRYSESEESRGRKQRIPRARALGAVRA